jgi:hypothetical protein
MPYYNQSTRNVIADIGLGLRVDRDAEQLSIVADPGDPFFDVHGLCIVTAIIGVCTVSAGGANNVFFRFNPDGTAATSDMSATADLGTAAVDGGMHILVGNPATAMTAATIGNQPVSLTAGQGIACYEGVIGLVADAALGTYRWHLWYLPLEDGSYIEVIP